uniref:Uncharacterized protein n=1 Tax=Arundo donax TaxID=35708 RepID=A0A0A9BUZ9_ARUDO
MKPIELPPPLVCLLYELGGTCLVHTQLKYFEQLT